MDIRSTSRLPYDLSVIGQGTWQLGADWGDVTEDQALAVLDAAYESGVRFFDTADVYGDGRSEQLIATYLRSRPSHGITVATKMGRRANPHTADHYTLDNFRRWTDRSRKNLGVDTLDLVQLHCPPSPVLDQETTYEWLDTLVAEDRIAHYGVSVETCAEALTAIAHPRVASLQIIVNAFRQKPLQQVLPAAADAGVAVIARVPLASGLLSGKYDLSTTFPDNDHRTYNRQGEAFDVGETFSGVPFDVGVLAAGEFTAAVQAQGVEATPAQRALRWLIDLPQITTVIPGARNADQARANALAAEQPPLDEATAKRITEIYDAHIRSHVHDRW
ncbi:aldo/keto reductase [Jonesia denitrificans]|uniref:Aldo/keto reductase n=1 Tax=Jonesia denitrificans (strain ATCC 14870 / DSM 20603 / BCRC 15368 / CIP 55.134 / JCM 11481 / NBRC 15587 / NCTC 10816 / Prevot 55134) TaxID=471856 RepID=C7R5E8_JONDD|nr:aldo/keto reductase [Jonesia denitrificans]ACV09221.1 aldo/keto reductase [Jonesia denitrificans DSM 20603]ASE09507.1 aldo/keto reductase [Jonesia denitrificans]QXB44053.1 aldo/keto reductase [Jonesia denitrificans]SQH21455.1 putative oxidoreductase [Jonesia denitrificans]